MRNFSGSKIGEIQTDYVKAVANQIVNLQQGYYEIQRVSITRGDTIMDSIGEFIALCRTFMMTLKSLGNQNINDIKKIEEELVEITEHIKEGKSQEAFSTTKDVMDNTMELLEKMRITKILFYRTPFSKQTDDYMEDRFPA